MKILFTVSLCCFCLVARSEMSTWTLKTGETFEGEYVSLVSQKVAVRNRRGQTIHIPLDKFSEEDIRQFELINPPELVIDFTKSRERRRYPPILWGDEIPQSYRYDFSATIKQTSIMPYTHELFAELYLIGREVYGHKRILIDYAEAGFRLDGLNSSYELKNRKTVELTSFLVGWQALARELGKEFDGYLLIVKDSRGEIIAHRTTSGEYLLENLENLKALPVGAYFDKTCTRCSPTRPKPYGY